MRDRSTKAFWEEDPPTQEKTATQIHVEDRNRWTGLYDANGKPLVREKEPFGFHVK